MTRATIYIFILLIFSAWQTPKGDLTVKVEGLKNSEGKVQIGLFNHPENFLDEGEQYLKIIIAAESPITTYVFKDIPFGKYALAVFHDLDGDDEMDKNLIGIPNEPYGFSNDIKPFLSAPSFKKTMIKFDKTQTIVIHLQD